MERPGTSPDSIFTDKAALDPLRDPDRIEARETPERAVGTTVDPRWIRDCSGRYLEATAQVDPAAILND